ncbi:MAG: 16S rRNA (guanine(527)-N(7))-methyltransferase RsmG [Deltaproteobacteria bacterium]|nr:16S rRNA (guanine(527)-N(7))-methyltransferase RsmG [Deltaproteobacteria bacterium]
MSIMKKLLERELDDLELQTLEKIKSILYQENKKLNLTRVSEDEFYQRHVVDSLLLVPFLKALRVETVLDFGTGAGYPGLPLALVLRDLRFFLFDKSPRKLNFLKDLCQIVKFDNVVVTNQAICVDVVVSRAVAKSMELVSLTRDLFRVCGLSLKSSSVLKELNELELRQVGIYPRVFKPAFEGLFINSHIFVYAKSDIKIDLQNFTVLL